MTRRRLLQAAALLAVLAVCVLVFRDVDLARLAAALGRAHPGLLALAVLLNLTVNTLARVERRFGLLQPLPRPGAGVSLGELTRLFLASYAANKLLPARAGDAFTTVHLHTRHGYSVEALVTAQLFEKVIEILSMWLLAIPFVLFAPLGAVPGAVRDAAVVVGVLGIAFILWLVQHARKEPGEVPAVAPGLRNLLRRAIARLSEAVRLMGATRVWLPALLWSWASDLADIGIIALVLAAVGIDTSVGTWFFIYLAVNVAIAVPVTPGQIGLLEAGAVVALHATGVPTSDAMAFALLYHAVHIVPTALLGAIGFGQLRLGVAAEPKA